MKKRLEEAKHYISYCLKEGVPWDEEELAQMSDKELIDFAEYQMAWGDHYAGSFEDEN